MKTFLQLCISGLLFLAACTDPINDHAFRLNHNSSFKINQEYTSVDDELKINIDSISDSRCPIGATCIWQGEARVNLSVEMGDIYHLQLSTFDRQKDTLQNLEFELKDVIPYPELGKEIKQSDYRIVLKITLLGQ